MLKVPHLSICEGWPIVGDSGRPVPILPGQREALIERLEALKKSQEHRFTKNVNRYFFEEDGVVEIILIWRSLEKPTENMYQNNLRAFQQYSEHYLDWNNARYSNKNVLIHT